jgi:predicted nucleic acid-binding protein
MRVLPDTPIWSAAFRRGEAVAGSYRDEMLKLVNQGIVEIIGPIRQEILSGIRDSEKFATVRDRLRTFPDLEIATNDYEEAAACYNRCRSTGIQGSFTDFVICAVAIRHELAIFTDDKDFLGYKKVLPIRLYHFGQNGKSAIA